MLKLIPVLFVVRVILLSYCAIQGLPWFRKMNFITSAFVWFLTGYWFSTMSGQKWISRIPSGLLIAGTIAGAVLAATEAWGVMVVSKIGIILYACCMFMYAVRKSEFEYERCSECHEHGITGEYRKRNAAGIISQYGRNAVEHIG